MRASDLARRRRGRKYISSAQGEAYDLEKMFAKLNRRHFDGELKKPTLTWSQRRTRNILGHHDRVRKAEQAEIGIVAAPVPDVGRDIVQALTDQRLVLSAGAARRQACALPDLGQGHRDRWRRTS